MDGRRWRCHRNAVVVPPLYKKIIEKKENGRQIQQKNIPSVIIFYANVSNSFEQQPRQYVW